MQRADPAAFREDLERVLSSGAFHRAARARRLLTYLVDAFCSGCAPGEVDIARDVYNLPNHRPSKSSRVRVALNDLRKRLEKYYGEERRDAEGEFRIPPQRTSIEHSLRSSAEVRFQRFGRFLAALSKVGLISSEPDQIIREWLKQPDATCVANLLRTRGVNDLEQITLASFLAEVRDSRIPFRYLVSLAHAYRIDPLLVNSFRSEEVEQNHLALRLEDDFIPSDYQTTEGSQGVRYHVPRCRLDGADADFCKLDLEAHGRSNTHEHLGDELCYVVLGSVEIRFEHSGLRTVLKQGDLIQFYAEQRHSVVATGVNSSVFIIRFHQLDERFMRQQMKREVQSKLGETHPRLAPLTVGWVSQMIESQCVDQPDKVHDKVGLARLLHDLRHPPFCSMPRDIDTMVEHRYDRSEIGGKQKWLRDLENARGEALKSQLDEIADLYGVSSVMLQSFLFQGVPNAIVVRGQDQADMRPLDSPTLGPGVTYFVPIRNLAFSEISVAKIHLQPGKEVPSNRHPGCELLLPLRGEVTAYYGPVGQQREICRVSQTTGTLAHFFSAGWHRVHNSGSELAELLVVRFYRDGAARSIS